MSITTMKKKHRWATFALAALVVAGGTVAVPQAASAYTEMNTCRYTNTCSLMVHTTQQDVRFTIKGEGYTVERYTVRTPGGRLLCRGTLLTFSPKKCYFGTYKGRVKITVTQNPYSWVSITANS